MAKVQRYDIDHDYGSAWMEPHSAGDYVTHYDYLALEVDYEILRKDYQSMMDKLKDIWSEG